MDAVGLDTVSFIEQNYVAERGLPDAAVKFLQKYIDEGRLGAKSDKGGLLPPRKTVKSYSTSSLYFLDIGLSNGNAQGYASAGRALV